MHDFLEKLRQEQGLSQGDLGDLVEMNQTAISRLESRVHASKLDVIGLVAALNKKKEKSPLIWARWLASSAGERIWDHFKHVLFFTPDTFDQHEKKLDSLATERAAGKGKPRDRELQISYDVWTITHNPPECQNRAEFDKTMRRLIRGNRIVYWIPWSHKGRICTLLRDLKSAQVSDERARKVDLEKKIAIILCPKTMGLLPMWIADPLSETAQGEATLGFASIDVGRRSTRYFVLPELTTDQIVQDLLKPIYQRVWENAEDWPDDDGFIWRFRRPSQLLKEEE